MDFVKNAMGGDKQQGEGNNQGEQKTEGGGGFLGGIGNKLNSAAGGGKESEKNEDYLDKGLYTSTRRTVMPILIWTQGIDAVQQYGFGGGDQSNESAVEQAKDEQISDAIRRQYKSAVGSDIPIKDKETRFG